MPIGIFIHKITYWQQTGMDGYGKRTFTSPVILSGRWNDTQQLKLNLGSEIIPSETQAWFKKDQKIAVGDYLAYGDQTAIADPTTSDTAFIVFTVNNSPSVTGTDAIVKVRLTPQ